TRRGVERCSSMRAAKDLKSEDAHRRALNSDSRVAVTRRWTGGSRWAHQSGRTETPIDSPAFARSRCACSSECASSLGSHGLATRYPHCQSSPGAKATSLVGSTTSCRSSAVEKRENREQLPGHEGGLHRFRDERWILQCCGELGELFGRQLPFEAIHGSSGGRRFSAENGDEVCQGSGELIASSSADLIAKLGSVKIAKSPSARTRASSAELIHGDAS